MNVPGDLLDLRCCNGNKTLVLIVYRTVKMIIFAVVTDKPRLVSVNIFPRLGRLDKRLLIPYAPIHEIARAGKRIISAVAFHVMEEKHYVNAVDKNDLRITRYVSVGIDLLHIQNRGISVSLPMLSVI